MLDITLVVGPPENDFARSYETRQVIYVSVRLVIEDTLPQPDHLADTEVIAQLVFNLLAAQAGVAVGIEQALLGNQHCAFAVDMQGAAFVDDGCPVALAGFDLENLARNQVVLVPRKIEAAVQTAPGVEMPIDSSHGAARVDYKCRPDIPHPAIIMSELDDAYVLVQQGARNSVMR